MDNYTTISNIAKVLESQIRKDPKLYLNHIYDMGKYWLVSIKTKEDSDLMDPYYIADKKTLKITDFKMLDHLRELNAALKNKVY